MFQSSIGALDNKHANFHVYVDCRQYETGTARSVLLVEEDSMFDLDLHGIALDISDR